MGSVAPRGAALLDFEPGCGAECRRTASSVARKHQWSVRATEDAVRRHSAPQAGSKAAKSAPRGATDPNVRRLETDLSEKLGATVAIEHGPKGGRVVIRYNGLEELEGILAHIK